MSYVERPSSYAGDPYYDSTDIYGYEKSGWLTFAGLMILFVGLWNAFEGFIGLFRSAYFTGTPIFGDLAFWSIVWIALGILQMTIAYAIFTGREWARWAGIVLVAANALIEMLVIPLYPWWALIVISLDALILFALTAKWPRAEPAMPPA